MKVIDWKKFEWNQYNEQSIDLLTAVIEEFKDQGSAQEMCDQLVKKLIELVDKIGVMKTISKHSRPWIDKDVSEILEQLRDIRKKFLKHRSMTNKNLYEGLPTKAEWEDGSHGWSVPLPLLRRFDFN